MNNHHSKSVKGERTLALAMCVFLGLVVIFNPFNKTTESILLSLLIIAVAIIPYFVWKRKRNRNLIILGVVYYGFFHMVGYGVTGFAAHEFALSMNVKDVADANEYTAKILVIAHLLIVFGGLYILQFLFSNSQSVKTSSNPKANITAYRVAIVVCFSLVVVEYFRVLEIPPFDMITGVIFSTVSFVAFMYLFYFLFYLNFGGRFIKILAIVGLVMARGGLVGVSQMAPYVEVALVLVLISIQKGRIPIGIFAALVVAFVILQPMKGAVRSMSSFQGYGVVESFTAGFQELQDIELDRNALALVDIAIIRVDYNLLLSSMIATIGARDEADYIGWKGYQNVLSAFIPRILWEDKPSDKFSNEWAVQEGFLQPHDYNTSYNLPWLPQAYLSFGAAGIIIGSFVVAILLFLLEKYYWTIRLDPWSFAIGYSILRPILTLETDFGMVVGIVVKVIAIDIIFRVTRALLLALRQNKSIIDRSNHYLKNG